jgi:hypothetical protein
MFIQIVFNYQFMKINLCLRDSNVSEFANSIKNAHVFLKMFIQLVLQLSIYQVKLVFKRQQLKMQIQETYKVSEFANSLKNVHVFLKMLISILLK